MKVSTNSLQERVRLPGSANSRMKKVLGSDLLASWARPLGLQVDCLTHPTLLLHQVLLHWAVPQTLRALLREAASPLTFLCRRQVCPVSLVFWAFALRAKRAHTGLGLGVLSCLLVRRLRFSLDFKSSCIMKKTPRSNAFQMFYSVCGTMIQLCNNNKT